MNERKHNASLSNDPFSIITPLFQTARKDKISFRGVIFAERRREVSVLIIGDMVGLY